MKLFCAIIHTKRLEVREFLNNNRFFNASFYQSFHEAFQLEKCDCLYFLLSPREDTDRMMEDDPRIVLSPLKSHEEC